MISALRLRVALRRGALVTAANWPMVVVEFAADALFKAALGVPIVGGALMVAALVGDDLSSLLSEGLRSAAGRVVASLVDSPAALVTFVLATGVVAAGGSVILFLVKAGTLAVIVRGEQAAPDALHTGPGRRELLKRAQSSNLEVFLSGVHHFGRRYVVLGAWLMLAYIVMAAAYLGVVIAAYQLAARTGWISAWPLAAIGATSALVVGYAVINLLYLLMQIIVAADDCRPGEAMHRLRTFLLHDARQVAGIFGLILTIVVLGMAASILATAGLGLVAWVPLIGLVVVPLQAGAWLLRGLVFEFIELTALTAYLTQYRRFASDDAD
jgi:hypothetical protein